MKSFSIDADCGLQSSTQAILDLDVVQAVEEAAVEVEPVPSLACSLVVQLSFAGYTDGAEPDQAEDTYFFDRLLTNS